MAKHYATFGSGHTHRINGKTFDTECVAVFDAGNATTGRARAFELFGRKFCMEYHGAEFDQLSMHFFPRGFVHVEGEDLY